MSSRRAMARAAALALVAGAALVSCGKGDKVEKFGQEIVLSKTLPSDDVARFNAFVPEPLKPGGNALDVLASGTEDWISPSTVRATRAGSPYVVAVRVGGKVTGDEGAVTLWLAGFELKEKPGRPPSTVRPITGLNAPKGGAKGDGLYDQAGATLPITVLEDEDIRPVVMLQRRAGLTIDRIDVEVWSGTRESSWIQLFGIWQAAILGVFMLAFWWFFIRVRN